EAGHLRLDGNALLPSRLHDQQAVGANGVGGPPRGVLVRPGGAFACARPQAGRIRIEAQDDLRASLGDLACEPVAERLRRRRSSHGARAAYAGAGRRSGDAIVPSHDRVRPRFRLCGKGRGYLTAFFSAAPAVNFGTLDAAIWIFSPVAGLRPSRALRCETLNLPKPENVTSLPRFRALSIVSSIASTASPASFLLNP